MTASDERALVLERLVGRRVRIQGKWRRIEHWYRDIQGGIRLDEPVDGFVSWNINDVQRGIRPRYWLRFWKVQPCLTRRWTPAALAEKLLRCRDHNCDGERHECNDCGGDGYVEAECGEDTCCCADPSDHGIEPCANCNGEGGWPCPLK